MKDELLMLLQAAVIWTLTGALITSVQVGFLRLSIKEMQRVKRRIPLIKKEDALQLNGLMMDVFVSNGDALIEKHLEEGGIKHCLMRSLIWPSMITDIRVFQMWSGMRSMRKLTERILLRGDIRW